MIGILEGLAEAIAGFSKGYFGKWSDLSGRRMPFVRTGYFLSWISRPIIGLFSQVGIVFLARTADRFGKGIRTGARDAILSDEAGTDNKGRVFGFHRALDTLGAVIGPTLALIYLSFYPTSYRELFLIAFIPGMLAFASTFLIREKKKAENKVREHLHFSDFFRYWKKSPAAYRNLVSGLIIFTLFNSSDVFLLLRAKEAGLEDTSVIKLFIFYNLIYALASYPLGILADKIKMKPVQISGLIIFATVYTLIAFCKTEWQFYGVFLLYGLYSAATEGISKAWISNIAAKEDTATAIGTFSGFQSVSLLIASVVCGFIWDSFGSIYTFTLSGAAALTAAVYLSLKVKK